MSVHIIAAIDKETRALGKGGKLLFRIKEDMQHFVEATMGNPVIMGRKTWESIPAKFRPLAGRTSVVVSRDPAYKAEGAQVFNSVEDAILYFDPHNSRRKIYVAGGAEIYTEALRVCKELDIPTELDLTLIESTPPLVSEQYDVTLSEFEDAFEKVEEEAHNEHVPPYAFTKWRMK